MTGNKRNEKRFYCDRTVSCTWSAEEPDLQDQDLSMYRQFRQKGQRIGRKNLRCLKKRVPIDYAKGSHFEKGAGRIIISARPQLLALESLLIFLYVIFF